MDTSVWPPTNRSTIEVCLAPILSMQSIRSQLFSLTSGCVMEELLSPSPGVLNLWMRSGTNGRHGLKGCCLGYMDVPLKYTLIMKSTGSLKRSDIIVMMGGKRRKPFPIDPG